MKNLVTLLFALFIVNCASVEAAQGKSITWLTSYDEAINQARTTQKPVILFFTGSDWCTWCQKLEKEVLDTQEFAREAGDQYIFVKVDTPFNTTLPKSLADQNSSLKKKYDVRSFPTLIIIDSEGRRLGSTGYRQGGAKPYIQHLRKLVGDYSQYHSKLEDLGKKKLSARELKELYVKAKELGRTSDAVQIIQTGIDSPNNHFFLIEQYRKLATEGKIFDDSTIALRERILEADPNNKRFTHYQIAVIDFEAASNEMEQGNFSPEAVVAPLISYIDQFGAKDPENLWRLEMIVSQVYFERGKLAEALKYARASYESAPASVQPEIATAIKSIESRIPPKSKG